MSNMASVPKPSIGMIAAALLAMALVLAIPAHAAVKIDPVPPDQTLAVSLSSLPAVVEAGQAATVTALVTYRDRPYPGAAVALSTPTPGASLVTAMATTDERGMLSATLMTGPSMSGSIRVEARATVEMFTPTRAGSYTASGEGFIDIPILTHEKFPFPPVALFSADPPSGEAPLTVTLNGQGSSDPDGSISIYAWDLGDGTTESGPTVIHTYTTPGTYHASLIVTDNDGLASPPMETETIVVQAWGPQPPDESIEVLFDPENPEPGDSVTITARYRSPVANPRIEIDVEGDGSAACDSMECTLWVERAQGDLNYRIRFHDPGGQFVDLLQIKEVRREFCPVNDRDCDGIPNTNDNCPDTRNKDQKDSNKDGEGDACDCNDHLKGPLEDDIDCGGDCTPCDICRCANAVHPFIPAAFDWRDWRGINWMTPVRNQDQCGSCWAFSGLGMTEAVYNIEKNRQMNLDLSEQDLVSNCYTTADCLGRPRTVAARLDLLRHLNASGVVDDACFTYTSGNCCYTIGTSLYCCDAKTAPKYSCTACTCGTTCSNPCPCNRCSNAAQRFWRISKWGRIGGNRDDIRKGILCHGPLQSCGNGHCIVIVGWNDARNVWIIKNSWGVSATGTTNGYQEVAFTDPWCGDAYYVEGVFRG